MFKNKPVFLLTITFCIVRLVLELIADSHSGFQGDELLHIETGNHPAWGYMEFPPVIGWLAYVQNLAGSNAVVVNHFFSHLTSIGILLLVAAIVVELGGKTKAVFIALLCVLAAPGFTRSQQLFQPVLFTHFFWLLSFYQLQRFCKTLHSKYLVYLVIVLAAGFLTKYDIVFFMAGLAGLLFVKRTRSAIPLRKAILLSMLFLLLISPNLIWQYHHDFPIVMHFSELYKAQLDQVTLPAFFSKLVVALNPFSLLIWLPGLISLFRTKQNVNHGPLALSIIISITMLGLAKGKFYYFFPVLLTVICFGSIWMENTILPKRKWLIYPVASLLMLSGILLTPYGLAVLPLKTFIRYAKIKKDDDGTYKIPYPEYYADELWRNTMVAIKEVYDSLPEEEKKTCRIWGKHYRQAGAVNLYRGVYNLPEAFSYHGSFYLWAPDGEMPATVIAFSNDSDSRIQFWQEYFSTVIPKKIVPSLYVQDGGDKQRSQTIYICRDPKQSFDQLKELFRKRIFE